MLNSNLLEGSSDHAAIVNMHKHSNMPVYEKLGGGEVTTRAGGLYDILKLAAPCPKSVTAPVYFARVLESIFIYAVHASIILTHKSAIIYWIDCGVPLQYRRRTQQCTRTIINLDFNVATILPFRCRCNTLKDHSVVSIQVFYSIIWFYWLLL